jgi:GNAT superfamily N-acetyltransferase
MTSSDADRVAALTCELGYPATGEQIARRFARIEKRPDQIVLVAEEAGVAIAWLHVAVHPYLESDAFAEILGLVVAEDRRNRRTGHALVQAAEEWARAQGCATMRVRSRITRDRAHAFYERGGFFRVKTQHCFEKTIS